MAYRQDIILCLALERSETISRARYYQPDCAKSASIGVLVVESSFGVLIWFKGFRLIILALGVCLHLTIEYSMNIPLFEWIMVATYITFLDSDDLSRVWLPIKRWCAAHVKTRPILLADYSCFRCKRTVELVRILDVFGLISTQDIGNIGGNTQPRHNCSNAAPTRMLTDSGFWSNLAVLISISPFIPMLWPLWPLCWLQINPKLRTRSDLAARG